jgi:hypothetical protein
VNLREWNVAVSRVRAANPRRCVLRARPGWPRARGQRGPSHTEPLGNGSRPGGPARQPGGHRQTTTGRPQPQPWPSRTLPTVQPRDSPQRPGVLHAPSGTGPVRSTDASATGRPGQVTLPDRSTTSGSRPGRTRAHREHPAASSRPGGTPGRPTRPRVPTRPSRPRMRSGGQQPVCPGGWRSACGAAIWVPPRARVKVPPKGRNLGRVSNVERVWGLIMGTCHVPLFSLTRCGLESSRRCLR